MTQTFANDNDYAKGLLLIEMMTDGEGNKFEAKENEYKLKNGWTGADLSEDKVKSDTARVFPALDRTVQMFYEGQSDPGKQTSTAYKYDVNGNITDYIDHGDDTPDDDLHATITYHNYRDKYLIGAPEHIIVTDGTKTLRERKSVIDPATGNVTQIRQFLSEDEVAVYDMEYDQYGNLEKITRPENEKGERLSIVLSRQVTLAMGAWMKIVLDQWLPLPRGNSCSCTVRLRTGSALEPIASRRVACEQERSNPLATKC